MAQSNPGLYQGFIPTAAQWNSYFAGKQDALTGTTPGAFSALAVAGPITLTNTTKNSVAWNSNGVAPPSFNTSSVGTKLLLYPSISTTTVDYAIGIESGFQWSSVVNGSSSTGWKWYAGTTQVAKLTGLGNLTVSGGIDSTIIGGVAPAAGTFTALTATNLAVSSTNNDQLAGVRNYVSNGAFDIWQRSTSFTSPVTGAYTTDRFYIQYDGTGATFTISKQACGTGQQVLQDAGFSNYMRYQRTVGPTSQTANNFSQRIESIRTLAGRQITISAYLWADAARTVSFSALQNTGGGSANVTTSGASFAINTTPTRYSTTLSLPTIYGLTIGGTGGDHLRVTLGMPTTGTCTINMAGFQVEAGPTATPFEWLPPQAMLAACQRYYYVGTFYNQDTATAAGNSIGAPASFPVTMRAPPTLAISINNSVNLTTPTLTVRAGDGLVANATSVAAGTMTLSATYTASADL